MSDRHCSDYTLYRVGQHIIIVIVPRVPVVSDGDDAGVEHGDDDEHDEREAAREGHVQPEPRLGARHAAEPALRRETRCFVRVQAKVEKEMFDQAELASESEGCFTI